MAEATPIPEFISRWLNREELPSLKNEDGSVSTHEMAAEYNPDDGYWYVYPTIANIPNYGLYRFNDPYEALSYNLKTGDYFRFADKKEALSLAKNGYKKKTKEELMALYNAGLTLPKK